MGDLRWRANWRAVGPPGAARAHIGRSWAGRRPLARSLRALPAGTPVVLSTPAPGATRRARRVAAAAGIAVEREYLAFPSASAPAYLVEDAPGSVRFFAATLLVAPPGMALGGAVETGLAALRAAGPWRLTRLLAPGRIVVGRRT
jgi:hypothetical protein